MQAEHQPKKSVAEEIKKPHFAVAQYPLDLKSKWEIRGHTLLENEIS